MVELVDGIMASLTADKAVLAQVADDEQSTMNATIVLLVSSLIAGIPAILNWISVGGNIETLIVDFLIEFLTLILIAFLFSGILGFVLRGFGGDATLIQSYRIFGYTSVWSAIGYIVVIILDLLDITGIPADLIFGIIGIIVLGIGLSAFSGISTVSAIIAAIIAYIIAFIVVFIIMFILILFVFAALFAGYESQIVIIPLLV